MSEAPKTIKLNLGRLADAKSEYALLASNVYFGVIRDIQLKTNDATGSAMFNYKVQVLGELIDTEGQPITSGKFFIFHSFSARAKPETGYNPDVQTRKIVEAVDPELLEKGDLGSGDLLNKVVKITVGIENPREYTTAGGEKKTVPMRNVIKAFTRLTAEEAEQIQVPGE